jgi:hypothetical protein
MNVRISIFRILLAAWACAGFCGLSWSQLSDGPEQSGREWVFQKPDYQGCPVFALSHESSAGCTAQPSREVLTLSIFGIGETPVTLPPPVFLFEGLTTESVTKARSGLRNRMKNRDPPVA